jgi:antitoxin ParD1/3/4
MDISVPDGLREWVQARVESGQYASASDYVRDLILRDQEGAKERAALVAALVEGEDSGISDRQVPDIFDEVKQELRGTGA